MNKNNFEKHDSILRNKESIIKEYDNNVSISKIAKIYGVSIGCISNNLKLWGVRKNHGIKFLLREVITSHN